LTRRDKSYFARKRFLLHSCHEHPPVIFIGTKLDALSLETEANSAFNRLDSDPG
jgi:hypothetical protein